MMRDDCRAADERLSASPRIRSACPRGAGREVEERGMSFPLFRSIQVQRHPVDPVPQVRAGLRGVTISHQVAVGDFRAMPR